MIRLNKHLKDCGYCSRREADRWIAEGLVKVNGVIETTLGITIDPEKDTVEIQGKDIQEKQEEKVYLVLNKPKGYVTTMKPTSVEKNIVIDLVPREPRVFPVGRLDKDTTGMLILTNDGLLANQLTHPSFEHEKEYEVKVEKPLTPGQIEKLESGLRLWGEKTKPTQVHKLSSHVFRIILQEGKNRQIRRICRKVGNDVVELKRVRVGRLWMPELKEGEYRGLSEEEVKYLIISSSE